MGGFKNKSQVCSNHGEQNKSNRAHVSFSDNLTSWTYPSAVSLNLMKLEFQGQVKKKSLVASNHGEEKI
jgi:hypothetical protein